MAIKFDLERAQHTVGFQREAIYNALDTITTLQIDNVLDKQMNDNDRRTMNFYLALQAITMEMTIRGMRVDEEKRAERIKTIGAEVQRLVRTLQKHEHIKPIWDKLEKNTGACAVPQRKDGKHVWEKGVPDGPERKCTACGVSRMKVRPFNPASDDDLKHLLYDLWKLKPQRNKDGNVTTDKEAREKSKEKSKKYHDTIQLIDDWAALKKKLEFLNFRGVGRFWSSFNVGVTNTHRWSSNANAFGEGGNSQNITEELRDIITADPGMELCYADLKQAESNIIAHVSGDEEYINAHLEGDTHTYVCRLVWPEGINGQQWTGDIALDKKIATSANPTWDDKPGHDFRFQSKAVQHGSNLGLTPFGMALQKRIPVAAATDGQSRYFRAFPGIRDRYQAYIRDRVQNQEEIVTPLGIRFKLFGRPWDEHTYKQALAVIPQSMVGHIISIGLWRIYHNIPEIQLLAQVHDAIVFQFPKGRYDLVGRALELMNVDVKIDGLDGTTRHVIIGTEAAVGHRWRHYNNKPERGELVLDGIREIDFHPDKTWTIK